MVFGKQIASTHALSAFYFPPYKENIQILKIPFPYSPGDEFPGYPYEARGAGEVPVRVS